MIAFGLFQKAGLKKEHGEKLMIFWDWVDSVGWRMERMVVGLDWSSKVWMSISNIIEKYDYSG